MRISGGNTSSSSPIHRSRADVVQVGIGIGGEYPAGSVSCAESTGEVKSGWRHFMFIM